MAVNGAANCKPRVTVVRDPKPVIVEFAKPKSQPTGGEEVVIIDNESFPAERDEINVNNETLSIFGKMRVKPDGSIVVAKPEDAYDPASCKHFISRITYERTMYACSANKTFNPN